MPTLIPLIEQSRWINPTLQVADSGHILQFHIQEVLNYHGYDAVGGVILGFRLLQKAIRILSPETPLQRRELSLFTAFPGTGARDCFELVTRMITEKRLHVDTEYSDLAVQKGVEGSFYFKFTYQQSTIELAPVEGYPGDTFIALGKASKTADFNNLQQTQWRNAKYNLANTLLNAEANSVIRVL